MQSAYKFKFILQHVCIQDFCPTLSKSYCLMYCAIQDMMYITENCFTCVNHILRYSVK